MDDIWWEDGDKSLSWPPPPMTVMTTTGIPATGQGPLRVLYLCSGLLTLRRLSSALRPRCLLGPVPTCLEKVMKCPFSCKTWLLLKSLVWEEPRWLSWLSVDLISAQVTIWGCWGRNPEWDLCRAWSLLRFCLLPVPPSPQPSSCARSLALSKRKKKILA